MLLLRVGLAKAPTLVFIPILYSPPPLQSAFSPLGAAMLVGLNAHVVEMVMAISLVFVILMGLRVHVYAWQLLTTGGCTLQWMEGEPFRIGR